MAGRVAGRAPQNIKALVAERVWLDIFQGRLRPNQKIDQDQLAIELGISKLPVREAMILLESEGLVENPPRRGCYVAALTPADIRDHCQLIGLVAGLAARRAAATLTDESLSILRVLLDKLGQAEDGAEREQLNLEFHRHISISGSGRRLRSALRLFVNTMPRHFYDFTARWTPEALAAHERILGALEARDPEASERAMREHLAWGADMAVDGLSRLGFWG
jgi:DNA-binding GntR family transcriptional regulator